MPKFYVTVTAGFYVEAEDAIKASIKVQEEVHARLDDQRGATPGLLYAETQPHEEKEGDWPWVPAAPGADVEVVF